MKIEMIFYVFLFLYHGTRAENKYGPIPTAKPLMWHAVFPRKTVERRAATVPIKKEEPVPEAEVPSVSVETHFARQDDRGPGEPIAPPSL